MGQSVIEQNIKGYDLCRFNHAEVLQILLKRKTLDFGKIQS